MSVEDSSLSPSDPVESVDGVGTNRGETLRENGYETVEDLQRSSIQELVSVLPGHTARAIKEQVGDIREVVTSAAQAREMAQGIPGAIAKTVRTPDGKQQPKVLQKVAERHEDGATIEIHKG